MIPDARGLRFAPLPGGEFALKRLAQRKASGYVISLYFTIEYAIRL